MAWSVAPDLSLQELGRTFTYLAVFAVAVVAARALPSAGRDLLTRHPAGHRRHLPVGAGHPHLARLAGRRRAGRAPGRAVRLLERPGRHGRAGRARGAVAGRPPRRAARSGRAGLPGARPAAADDHAHPVPRRAGRRRAGRAGLAGLRAPAPAHGAGPGRGCGRRGPDHRVGAVPGGVHGRASAAGGARGRGRDLRPAHGGHAARAHGRRLRRRAHPGHDEALARAAPPLGHRPGRGPGGGGRGGPGVRRAPRAAASASSWTS